jgi:hypothetical protein
VVLTLDFDDAEGGVCTIVKRRVTGSGSIGGNRPLNNVQPVVVGSLQCATAAGIK